MKKSAYLEARGAHWRTETGMPCPELVLRDVAAVEAAGVAWDPEAPEWPELFVSQIPQGGFHLGLYLERDLPDRIARAWNARRPEGPMEALLREQLRVCCGEEPKDCPACAQFRMALRLGVEE